MKSGRCEIKIRKRKIQMVGKKNAFARVTVETGVS